MNVVVRTMALSDVLDALALWHRTPGIGLSESDTPPAVSSFLGRNQDLSAVALSPDGLVVGGGALRARRSTRIPASLGGGRRPPQARYCTEPCVEHCIACLQGLGILKCNIFLFRDNGAGADFWQHNGWSPHDDLRVLQIMLRLPRRP